MTVVVKVGSVIKSITDRGVVVRQFNPKTGLCDGQPQSFHVTEVKPDGTIMLDLVKPPKFRGIFSLLERLK